jgi:hypothetical protein
MVPRTNQNPSRSRKLHTFIALTIKNPIPFCPKEALYDREYRVVRLICAWDGAATFDLLSRFLPLAVVFFFLK